MHRHGRRWKPSTRASNARLIDRHLVPFFGRCVTPRSTAPMCAAGLIPCAERSATPTGRRSLGGGLAAIGNIAGNGAPGRPARQRSQVHEPAGSAGRRASPQAALFRQPGQQVRTASFLKSYWQHLEPHLCRWERARADRRGRASGGARPNLARPSPAGADPHPSSTARQA